METSKLKDILEQHRLWIESNGVQGKCANLKDADLTGANLEDANLINANLSGANLEGAFLTGETCLTDANLTGASLEGANLSGAILPDISWIIPGCLAKLNQISCPFYLAKENKHENFIQDSFGFFIQDNPEEGTFDMLVEDRIIRNIPDWLKYTGLKQVLL